jgi:putative inorganic carbon (hco3(-)) transporter
VVSRRQPGSRVGDLWWLLVVGGGAALVLGWLVAVSVQAACAFVLVMGVIALYEHDRRWGIAALFVFWFLAPGLRRVFGLMTGYLGQDPLSLAPFLATAAIAGLELQRVQVPTSIRRIFLIAAAGFAIGLPVGLLTGPRSAAYAFIAYLAGVSGAALGFSEDTRVRGSTLRRVLLFILPPIAAYAIAQRFLPLPSWDRAWIDATQLASVGGTGNTPVRAFATLNSPGALAPLLGLALLSYLTVTRARTIAVIGAAVVAVALSLTFVRSAWVALIVAGLAHIIASEGRSARLILPCGAAIVAATLALAPVSSTARDVLDRFKTIQHFRGDTSSSDRSATLSRTLPRAVEAPLGHGLGSAGEPSKLSGDSALRAPDNGYLSLMYQAGPIGFLLVMAAIAYVLRAAWDGARARAPGQELRLFLFAMLVYLLVLLYAGDEFYGSHGVILWFIAGQVLAYDYRLRAATA